VVCSGPAWCPGLVVSAQLRPLWPSTRQLRQAPSLTFKYQNFSPASNYIMSVFYTELHLAELCCTVLRPLSAQCSALVTLRKLVWGRRQMRPR
jgi:hypothetical protein